MIAVRAFASSAGQHNAGAVLQQGFALLLAAPNDCIRCLQQSEHSTVLCVVLWTAANVPSLSENPRQLSSCHCCHWMVGWPAELAVSGLFVGVSGEKSFLFPPVLLSPNVSGNNIACFDGNNLSADIEASCWWLQGYSVYFLVWLASGCFLLANVGLLVALMHAHWLKRKRTKHDSVKQE
eukprot:scaffold676_cov50-Prasinocladus_malaysianus.AAC.1